MDKEKQKKSISVGNALFEVVGWRVAYCAPREEATGSMRKGLARDLMVNS